MQSDASPQHIQDSSQKGSTKDFSLWSDAFFCDSITSAPATMPHSDVKKVSIATVQQQLQTPRQTDRGAPASLEADIRCAEVVHPVGEIHKQEDALENPEERSHQWRSYFVTCEHREDHKDAKKGVTELRAKIMQREEELLKLTKHVKDMTRAYEKSGRQSIPEKLRLEKAKEECKKKAEMLSGLVRDLSLRKMRVVQSLQKMSDMKPIHFGKSFKAGQTVVIHGLTRDMQYNGQRGRIVPRFGEDYSTHLRPGEDGRWVVQFENMYLGRKEFKTENLMKVGKSADIGALASVSEASSAPTFSPRTHGTRSSSVIPELDYGTWGFDGTGATSPAQDSPRSATQPAKPLIARRGSI